MFDSSTRWTHVIQMLFIATVAIEWFGWFHGLGVAVAVSFLAPPHPSEGASNVVDFMILAKKKGLL